jgi:hypothetical protein
MPAKLKKREKYAESRSPNEHELAAAQAIRDPSLSPKRKPGLGLE